MIAVIGTFRFPPESLHEARSRMRAVIEATRSEEGCVAYSYAEDVTDPGLFRVTELWDSRDALSVHFETDHMRHWSEQRTALGFFDRRVTVYEVGGAEEL